MSCKIHLRENDADIYFNVTRLNKIFVILIAPSSIISLILLSLPFPNAFCNVVENSLHPITRISTAEPHSTDMPTCAIETRLESIFKVNTIYLFVHNAAKLIKNQPKNRTHKSSISNEHIHKF